MGRASRYAQGEIMTAREMVIVENVNHPGKTTRLDAAKYKLARAAMLKFLPKTAPGLTQAEMMKAMRQALPRDLFPGTTSSWWMKSVQLDLEAKGLVVRDKGKPLRWRRA
jgi:hypothetical protein